MKGFKVLESLDQLPSGTKILLLKCQFCGRNLERFSSNVAVYCECGEVQRMDQILNKEQEDE